MRALGARRLGPAAARLYAPTVPLGPRVRQRGETGPSVEAPSIAPSAGRQVPAAAVAGDAAARAADRLVDRRRRRLNLVVGKLHAVIDQAPVLITQHMPPTFTAILAEHLTRASGRPAHEAVDGEPVLAGKIYVAPGGRHMRVARRDGEPVIALHDGADPFLQAGGRPAVLLGGVGVGQLESGLVLTGMGTDGTKGAAEIVAAGGCVIAQDEASSVVWGMPGSVAHAGLASAVLALDQIAPRVARMFAGAVHDAGRLRLSAQAPEGAFRPRAGGGQAIPGGEPAASGRPPGGFHGLGDLVLRLKARPASRSWSRWWRR